MIFFLVMPGLFGGFGNYFAPIFQGSPEVVYPRVNNLSILILFLSYLFVVLSFVSEFGGGTMDIISTIKHFFHEYITFSYSLSCLWIINVGCILMSNFY